MITILGFKAQIAIIFLKGSVIEEAFISTLVGPTSSESIYPQNFICIPCEPGCRTCVDDSPCFVQFNIFIRAITLGIQSFCATITLMIGIAICKLRRQKVCQQNLFYKSSTNLNARETTKNTFINKNVIKKGINRAIKT